MVVDHAMCRQETLRLLDRLELLHLTFSPSRRTVRVFCPVVQILTGAVPHLRQQLALRDAVAAQAVRDDAAWLVLEAG